MGDLAFEYGFYGTEWKGPGMYGEAGEALMVTDPHEAWVFHILPDGTDNSAVWAAQRYLFITLSCLLVLSIRVSLA
jgi:hypothetical protein